MSKEKHNLYGKEVANLIEHSYPHLKKMSANTAIRMLLHIVGGEHIKLFKLNLMWADKATDIGYDHKSAVAACSFFISGSYVMSVCLGINSNDTITVSTDLIREDNQDALVEKAAKIETGLHAYLAEMSLHKKDLIGLINKIDAFLSNPRLVEDLS